MSMTHVCYNVTEILCALLMGLLHFFGYMCAQFSNYTDVFNSLKWHYFVIRFLCGFVELLEACTLCSIGLEAVMPTEAFWFKLLILFLQ